MARGRHLLVDLTQVPHDSLADADKVVDLMKRAARQAGATVQGALWTELDPPGFAAVVLLNESHLSLHVFAEERIAALDVFCCGRADPRVAVEIICSELGGIITNAEERPRFLEKPPGEDEENSP